MGARIYKISGRGRKSGTFICIISGRGRKTVGASAPTAPIRWAPLTISYGKDDPANKSIKKKFRAPSGFEPLIICV